MLTIRRVAASLIIENVKSFQYLVATQINDVLKHQIRASHASVTRTIPIPPCQSSARQGQGRTFAAQPWMDNVEVDSRENDEILEQLTKEHSFHLFSNRSSLPKIISEEDMCNPLIREDATSSYASDHAKAPWLNSAVRQFAQDVMHGHTAGPSVNHKNVPFFDAKLNSPTEFEIEDHLGVQTLQQDIHLAVRCALFASKKLKAGLLTDEESASLKHSIQGYAYRKPSVVIAVRMTRFLAEDCGWDINCKGTRIDHFISKSPYVLEIDPEAKDGAKSTLSLLRDLDIWMADVLDEAPALLHPNSGKALNSLIVYLKKTFDMTKNDVANFLTKHPQALQAPRACVGEIGGTVAFLFAKGMDRPSISKYINECPEVCLESKAMLKLKLDWLAEECKFTMMDIAAVSDLMRLDFVEELGPCLALAKHLGYDVIRPSATNKGLKKSLTVRQAIDLKSSWDGYEEFRNEWQQKEFSTWLVRRGQ